MNPASVTDQDELNDYLDSVEYLPPAPTLLTRLIDLFRQPDREIDEVVALMKQDPALTTELLRCCNSSFFGFEDPVMDVGEAVFRLGFYEVYRLSVSLFGLQAISKSTMTNRIQVERLWRHSAITAIVAGTLARQTDESEGVAFTAGLLHDIGRIVLASAEGEGYADLFEQHGHCGPDLEAAERLVYGFGHAQIGARLLSRWDVPPQVSVPVLCHHYDTWSGPFQRMAAVVSLANILAHALEIETPCATCSSPAAAQAMELLGLKPEDMAALKQLAEADVKRSLSFFVSATGGHP